MKRWISLCIAIAAALIGSVFPFGNPTAEAAAPTMVHYGSQNGDVWDVQARLNRLGYPTTLDGIYGLETERQVIEFQKDHRLRIDGIVGPETWAHLKKTQPTKVSRDERMWMARAVYSEARGEPYKGQVAVAAVVLNRLQSDQFPNTAKGVILEEGAFTAVSDGQIWLKPDHEAHRAVQDAINGWDPTEGALYYFNPDTATSDWIWSRPQIKKIGKHIFAR
ncbi:spore cortex-lytic enzyme [Melghirimyces algeriensis]|uniref:Spore cortex-lytic enzyme n=1 Tax=Melghirimyces algeriensis TaxID=910412 RepID=A0A521ETC6_9BACL|nr:spore cortex-lytic enzyme [Melghirimyces algeriensis]SMO86340.1 N-acetylmuramoyl-L-alanine amidase [Melghirimyces algeriensis]